MSKRRMSRALAALGDGEFFDYSGGADVDIPADQLDWSGDYAISPTGAMTGSSIYGNTGDSIQWNWGGDDNLSPVAMETSSNWFNFDAGAILDAGRKYGGAAVDLYKRTQGGNPPPTNAPGAKASAVAVRPAGGVDLSKLALPVGLFLLMKAIA